MRGAMFTQLRNKAADDSHDPPVHQDASKALELLWSTLHAWMLGRILLPKRSSFCQGRLPGSAFEVYRTGWCEELKRIAEARKLQAAAYSHSTELN